VSVGYVLVLGDLQMNEKHRGYAAREQGQFPRRGEDQDQVLLLHFGIDSCLARFKCAPETFPKAAII
jgi:hypothetical protein